MATREQIDKVIGILLSDDERRFVVVSAPGKKDSNDTKITDLLIQSIGEYKESQSSRSADQVKQRIMGFGDGIQETSVELCNTLDARLANRKMASPYYDDTIKAFGEYASARIITVLLKNRGIEAEFCDPGEIKFNARQMNGTAVQPDPSCYDAMGKTLLAKAENKRFLIIPGFYAFTPDGNIVTFPRGGSDTSGAAVARAVNATVYENWTDEDGLYRADPRVVKDPKIIREITYAEARELAYMGFKLQMDTMLPVESGSIPILVKNTNNVQSNGTLVVSSRLIPDEEYIAGVACRKGYIPIEISKPSMNQEIGFGERVFSILKSERISYEHAPTGIDDMCIIIEKNQLAGPGILNTLERKLREGLDADVQVGENMALVVVAGLGMRSKHGVSGRILSALGSAGIHDRMLNKGASEISFFIGVDERHAEDAVRAIYTEFYGD